MNSKTITSPTNMQMLLRVIKEKSPITKREIQDITGFSWGLVSAKVNALAGMGYIIADSRDSDGVGRKAEEYDINHERNLFIGIDVHCEGVLVAVTDMKGRVVEQEEREFSGVDRQYILELLFHILDRFFDKYEKNFIIGMGIAVQGVVDRERGISVLANGIDGWHDVPLKQIMEERYQLDVIVEHDTDCLMFAESSLGHLNQRDVRDAMVVSVNYNVGIGMSVMLNGDIYRGWHGKAAELGYAIVDDSLEEENRLLENHSTKKNIVEDYKKLVGNERELSYNQIVEGAYNGDEDCRKVLSQAVRYIATAICSANNILNPEMSILHAPTCEFKEFLFSSVEECIEEYAYDKEVREKFSKLGKEARAVGGALSAIEKAIYSVE